MCVCRCVCVCVRVCVCVCVHMYHDRDQPNGAPAGPNISLAWSPRDNIGPWPTSKASNESTPQISCSRKGKARSFHPVEEMAGMPLVDGPRAYGGGRQAPPPCPDEILW